MISKGCYRKLVNLDRKCFGKRDNYDKLIKFSGTRTNFDFLLLLLSHAELFSKRRAVLAFMIVEDLLDLQKSLAAVLILASLLVLLCALGHDLGGSTGELWNTDLLRCSLLLSLDLLMLLLVLLLRLVLLLLLLLDLNIICFLQEGIFSLRSKQVLRLIEFIILLLFVRIVHRHLVGIIACHGSIHVGIHLLVHLDMVVLLIDFPTLELALNSRLAKRGDEDTAAASTFLVYI